MFVHNYNLDQPYLEAALPDNTAFLGWFEILWMFWVFNPIAILAGFRKISASNLVGYVVTQTHLYE